MARPGPKPLPTVVKLVRGNPGKRPLNENEPQPEKIRRIPQPPSALKGNKVATATWKKLARKLMDMRVLGDVDVYALEQLCSWYARWHSAEAMLQKHGDVIPTSNNNLIQSPYLPIARRASEMMLKFMAELGLTPSSRSRVDLWQANGDSDDLFD